MKAVSVLHAEHEGVLVVLTQLERAVAAAERALPVPADVFTDIGEFFSVFVDRCHHSEEQIGPAPMSACTA
jgi:hemerythrin-like domain-containing protein